MKISEIINDLKRLNSYLPKDPQKNYANPLDRMARELCLIREFALQGDQKYVAVQLELTSASGADPALCYCQDCKKVQKIPKGKSQEFLQKLSIAIQKNQVPCGATEHQMQYRNGKGKLAQVKKLRHLQHIKFHHVPSVCLSENSFLAPTYYIVEHHNQLSNQWQSPFRVHGSLCCNPSSISISVVSDILPPKMEK